MDEQNSPQAQNTKRTILIITFSMIMGVVMFAVVTFLIAEPKAQPDDNLISYVMAGLAVLCLAAATVVPGVIVSTLETQKSSADEQPDYMTYLGIYQTRTIIQYALLEGGAFANLVAVFVEGNRWSLMVAGALLFVMIIQLPTPGRIDNWIRHRREMNQFGNWNQ
ncbi:hypothetical protein [Rubinisphaera margarita]|uniref:hypothetical protein n=1 Tax=Rubinisphaera margarita TaxID=2909586 RepID=UPI001EE84810|nr:hypothetical protein [Rubinisphaera margarita]MCG6156840.1 hypothetical protein [Rubinisphaera margarita]